MSPTQINANQTGRRRGLICTVRSWPLVYLTLPLAKRPSLSHLTGVQIHVAKTNATFLRAELAFSKISDYFFISGWVFMYMKLPL